MDSATRNLYRLKADVLAAAGHPLRLAIIEFLKGGERCVCDIAAHVDAERSNVSRHLAVLLRVGLVDCRKEGLRIYYSLKTPCILNFLTCVTRILRHRVKADRAVLRKLS